ncbi:hypothetical protein [Marinococcus sp. PL1-022]|uniref:hypothetical protein n=1 Tax=Marinococcus sp. PL1-022 TaxID=3095363 RepID=UPI0029C3E461|nr:hypothetical protein [Marinococcus sp. PL1-022]MDX6154498.1 hypothetical protein [Marinococcus sp. PL1-022]
MTFLSQYGFFIAIILVAAGLVWASSYFFSRRGKILSSGLLGLTGLAIIIYSFLVPEDPFSGIAYGALAFCILLGVSMSWAFANGKDEGHR